MRFRTWVTFLCVLLSTFFAIAAQAAPPDTSATAQLSAARRSVIALQESAERGVITRSQADEASRPYLDQAAQSVGHPVTVEQLVSMPDAAASAASEPQLTGLQRFAGYITLINVLKTLGAALGVLCFTILFGSYVVDLIKALKNVPLVVYEVIFYGLSLGLLFYGKTLSAENAPYCGLVGSLLFAGAMAFSRKMRKFVDDGFRFFGILFIVWTTAALVYGSSMIGFIAVTALLGALGFSVAAGPLCYCIGFKDEAAVGKATSSAFVILAAFVGMRVLGKHVAALAPFEFGALFMGSFVGYLGLLISSSRWYDGKRANYVLFQIVTIVAGFAAIGIGSVFGIGELLKIGGTFFVLYILEKTIEIPAKGVRGYAAVGLAASVVLFAIGMFARSNMDMVAPYLFTLH